MGWWPSEPPADGASVHHVARDRTGLLMMKGTEARGGSGLKRWMMSQRARPSAGVYGVLCGEHLLRRGRQARHQKQKARGSWEQEQSRDSRGRCSCVDLLHTEESGLHKAAFPRMYSTCAPYRPGRGACPKLLTNPGTHVLAHLFPALPFSLSPYGR